MHILRSIKIIYDQNHYHQDQQIDEDQRTSQNDLAISKEQTKPHCLKKYSKTSTVSLECEILFHKIYSQDLLTGYYWM